MKRRYFVAVAAVLVVIAVVDAFAVVVVAVDSPSLLLFWRLQHFDVGVRFNKALQV